MLRIVKMCSYARIGAFSSICVAVIACDAYPERETSARREHRAESTEWAYVVSATAEYEDSARLRTTGCGFVLRLEMPDSLVDSIVVRDVLVRYSRSTVPFSFREEFSRTPGVGVRVDTNSIVESVRLFRLTGDSIRLVLGSPLHDTLGAAKEYIPPRYRGTWICPGKVPLGDHMALDAEGYQPGAPFNGSWILRMYPFRRRVDQPGP